MSLFISNATVIDGVAEKPIEGQSISIEHGRITAIGRRDEIIIPKHARVIDAHGKYIIPGLMDANVHLFGAFTLERLARHIDRYEDIIVEAAQIALKGGLTTVFDTWGPRRCLIAARNRINAGKVPGSRVFCAGNIIGFDGLFSPDFFPKCAEVASTSFTNKINAIWTENVGRHLMWLPPERVAQEVRAYIEKGIDFVKYASNEHGSHSSGAFLAFSPRVQRAIVDEAHRSGLSVQSHTTSVEGLHLAVEAGCDLIQHANTTGPVPIPESLLELMSKRGVGAVVFPFTQRRLEWMMSIGDERARCAHACKNVNVQNLIRARVPLLMAWDAMLVPPEMPTDPKVGKYYSGVDDPTKLGEGHIYWFKAMEELGCAPMEMLRAATKNVAVAYGKSDMGTIEKGKIADLLVLDKNPLTAAENYRSIHLVIKDGAIVDRDALPLCPIFSGPTDPPAEEENCYVPATGSADGLPCACH